MYTPQQFAVNDQQVLHEFMRQHDFATLVTQHDGAPYASHLQIWLGGGEDGQGSLFGHIARNNPQAQDFAAGAEVLAIFHGPHAYVSPSWYEPNPMAVPTWNYMAVHAYGTARILPEDELEQVLHRQVEVHEKMFYPPWKLELSAAMRERMLGVIAGFEIRLKRLEGKFKLSQNKSERDRRNVIARLSESEGGKQLARWMKEELEKEND